MTFSFINFNEKELEDVCKKNDILSLAIFGSVARGKNKPESDIDLLAKFGKPKSLFELVDLETRLSRVFGGKKIDLVTEGFLSPFIRDSVIKESKAIYLYG